MTLRIEAGERLSVEVREMVREPTGEPLSRYASTTIRKTSRARSLISPMLVAMTAM